MKLNSRFLVVFAVLSTFGAAPASAQYLKLISDNPGDPTKLRTSGTTLITITLDTSHDRDGSLQTCNSHTAAVCDPALGSSSPLDIGSYVVTLTAAGGTVTWGTYSNAMSGYTDNGSNPATTTQMEANFGRASGFDPAGLYTLGTIPVTVASGDPRIVVASGPQAINPFGFGTGFGTECEATLFPHTYTLGDPLNLCSTGDWVDADGLRSPSGTVGNNPVTLAPVQDMQVVEGTTADQVVSATDPDGDAISLAFAGPSFMVSLINVQVGNTVSATIHLAPPFGASGTFSGSVTATANGSTDHKSFTITVTSALPAAPVLAQPSNMTVEEGHGSGQLLHATDANGDPLTFSLVSGPTFTRVTTSIPGTGSAEGLLHVDPGFNDAGTYTVTVGVSDGALDDTKFLYITVNDVPTLPATVVLSGGNRTIRIGPRGGADWIPGIQASSFLVSDIIPASIVVKFGGISIQASGVKRVTGGAHGNPLTLPVVFEMVNLGILFDSVPPGSHTVDLTIRGIIAGGGVFEAPVTVTVEKKAPGGHASPNPFNPYTTISFETRAPGKVRLRIFDVSGRLVTTLADRAMGAGLQEVRWDGTTRMGSRVSSGVYFYVLETPSGVFKNSLVVAR